MISILKLFFQDDNDSRGSAPKGASPNGKSSGSESPKAGFGIGGIVRKRFGSMADDLDNVAKFNGVNSQGNGDQNNQGGNSGNADLEAMKQEILREMRKEINKMKAEIIDGKNSIHKNI